MLFLLINEVSYYFEYLFDPFFVSGIFLSIPKTLKVAPASKIIEVDF